MKIIVCMKQVPLNSKVEIDEEAGNLKRMGSATRTNPFDLVALEYALRVRDQIGGTATVLTDICCPTIDSCQHMATANSMCCMAETVGMSLPGSAVIVPEVRHFEGTAICFSGEDETNEAIEKQMVKPGHVVIIRRAEPPKALPGGGLRRLRCPD